VLEFGGLPGIGEGYVGDEAPRFEFCRVRGLTGIVLGQALFQICRDADVAPALAARTYQQIDVMHSRRVGTPIASGVRIFRRSTSVKIEGLYGLFRPLPMQVNAKESIAPPDNRSSPKCVRCYINLDFVDSHRDLPARN